jgi:hypothetical protein
MEAIEKPETQMCDQPGCPNTAESSYAWDWGQRGVCCQSHAALFQQLQPQLNRSVIVSPLQNASVAVVPMQRDERVRLQADVLVLREEVNEANVRGVDLFRENTKLAQQVQLYSVRERELRAQLKDAEARTSELAGKLEARDVEHGELVAELDRLRTLERFMPGGELPSAFGLGGNPTSG